MGKVATSPLRFGEPHLFRAGGGNSNVAHQWAKWLRHPFRLGDPNRVRAGGKIRSGPQVGKVATSPLLSRGCPPLWRGGGNQTWPTSGQSGYITPAVSVIPTASERGTKSEVARLWAKWLHHPCCVGDPHRFRAGGEIRSGPLVGKVAMSPLPSRGSPPLQSGWQNQTWPTSGQSGYVTPAVSGIPTASERAALSEVAHCWAKWLRHRCRLGDPHRFRAGRKIRSAPQVGTVATSPLRFGIPHRFRAGGGGELRRGPTVGKVAMSPLAYRASPPLQSGAKNQKWPTSGQSGYVTLAVPGIPTVSERGGKSEVAHKWEQWLHHPFVSGIPTASEQGGKSDVAHKLAKWLHLPCHLGDTHRFRAGCKIRSGPLVGKVATSPLPSRGSPPLQSGGENQTWPTSGQSGYITPAVSGIPTVAERGGKSEVAHKWAKWLHHPCCLPPCCEWHPGVPAPREPPPVPGPAGGVLEAPTRRPLPTVDHRARFHDRMGGAHRGGGVGAGVEPVVRRHARPGDSCQTIRRHPAPVVGAGHPAETHHDPRGGA